MEPNLARTSTKMLPGCIVTLRPRCGRPNCRCANGKPHGPYFARIWRERGQKQSVYVKREEVHLVRAQCETYREWRRALAAGRREYQRLIAVLREVERNG